LASWNTSKLADVEAVVCGALQAYELLNGPIVVAVSNLASDAAKR